MTTYYFSLLLVFATLLTGIIWALDHWIWKPKRDAKIAEVEAKSGTKLNELQAQKLAPQSAWADFSQAAFPVLLVILILRSFIYEPFRIPSGSMMPTLLVGDFIMVEKFRYGLRDPVTRTEFLETGRPQRGDVAVFKYPVDPNIDYIKRVVGMPGDRVLYRNKAFFIYEGCAPNCAGVEPVAVVQAEQPNEVFFRNQIPLKQYREQLGSRQYDVLVDPFRNQLTQDFIWDVPAEHYFFVGDNRDNSLDSRFWGFVHEDKLVGRATFIWLSLEFERDASSWLPQWIPSRVRFDRLGRIE